MGNDDLSAQSTNEQEVFVQLEHQVERGSLFTHTVVSRNADRIHEAESFLYGLIDTLIEKGMITQDEVAQATGKVRQEMEEKGQTIGPGIALRVDGSDDRKVNFVQVNCAERYHICKAVCCKLHFALTVEEVESGKIKWDLGEPYYIRQESKGCCHHLNQNTNQCSIYEDRPGICRSYSCANDERIWKDFENMVLNEEWISEHLGKSRFRLMTMQMLPQNIAYQPVGSKTAPHNNKD